MLTTFTFIHTCPNCTALRPRMLKPLVYIKIHKDFDNLTPFQSIIDTNVTKYYLTTKFLAKLLKPLTTNGFSLDGSFDAARKINNIPKVILT